MSEAYEVDLLAEQLHRQGICIGQINDKRFARAFLQRGLADADLKVFLATMDHQVVGWTIGIRNSHRYWRRVLLSHPLWAMQIVAHRLWAVIQRIKLFKNFNTQRGEGSHLQSCRIAKLELQPNEIATHIDITVLDAYRLQGIASKLEQLLADELRRSGVRLIKGVIAEWNNKSKSFHEKRGWTVLGKSEGFYQIIKIL